MAAQNAEKKLDRSRIAIRERSYVDVLDLALRTSRVHARPLLVAFLAGVVPLMLVNHWLLAGYSEPDFELGIPAQYMLYMLLLVTLEAPLATALATLYLGEALFADRPSARTIARHFCQSLPQLLLYQGLLRIWYLRWPYLNEVILLDRNTIRRKGPEGESTLRRSRIVHRADGGDVLTRGFRVATVGGALFASVWFSLFFGQTMLVGEWEWGFDQAMYTFCFPLALWLVAAYFAVVRFLGYLDLRIRHEGWEVELLMRAERARLERRWD
jgi:hypothetical protein